MASIAPTARVTRILPAPIHSCRSCRGAHIDGEDLRRVCDLIIEIVSRRQEREDERQEFLAKATQLGRARWAHGIWPGDTMIVGLRWWGELGDGDAHTQSVTPLGYPYKGPFRQGSNYAYWFAGWRNGRLVPLRVVARNGERLLDLDLDAA